MALSEHTRDGRAIARLGSGLERPSIQRPHKGRGAIRLRLRQTGFVAVQFNTRALRDRDGKSDEEHERRYAQDNPERNPARRKER